MRWIANIFMTHVFSLFRNVISFPEKKKPEHLKQNLISQILNMLRIYSPKKTDFRKKPEPSQPCY
jgi:hypothetical protein